MPWLLEMTLVVAVLMVPAVLYLSVRLYFISKKSFTQQRWLKLILPILFGSFYLFPLIGVFDFYISGGIDVLKYPKPLTYWFWFGLVFVFQLATWFIIADLLKLLIRFLNGDKNWVSRAHKWTVFGLTLVVFCFVGWKTYHDTTQIQVDSIRLPIDNLSKSAEGLKIVHISDIQGDEYTGRNDIARYIQKVNDQNPDMVIFTGDLISYGTDYIEQSAEEFGEVQAKYGTLAVVGDHDYWAGVNHVRKALKEENIPLLQEENYQINVDSSASITVTGVTEVYSKSSDPDVVDSLAESASDEHVKIFASHQVKPHIIETLQKQRYDLLLAGHTHGGQIRVPFMGMTFSASERETDYVSGLYQEGELTINVNNGLGFTLGPIRYNAPPNISVITLKRK